MKIIKYIFIFAFIFFSVEVLFFDNYFPFIFNEEFFVFLSFFIFLDILISQFLKALNDMAKQLLVQRKRYLMYHYKFSSILILTCINELKQNRVFNKSAIVLSGIVAFGFYRIFQSRVVDFYRSTIGVSMCMYKLILQLENQLIRTQFFLTLSKTINSTLENIGEFRTFKRKQALLVLKKTSVLFRNNSIINFPVFSL
jgi:hypothetical protein